MKINEKNKKTSSVKTKTASKTASKPALKTKKTTSSISKTVSKSPAKAAKPVAKPTAKATPKKSVKAAVKPAAKAVTALKTKTAAVKAAPQKVTPVAAKAKQQPAAPAKKASLAAPKAEKQVKAAAKPVVSAIVVKMAENQNAALRTPIITTGRTVPTQNLAPQKVSTPESSAARPVYRPIQVINKPLAPTQPVRQMAPVAKSDEKVEFKKGDFVVYPAHGVGEIEAVEVQIIGGMEIKLYAISFEKDRMRLKVPVFKAHASGLRRLSSQNQMQDAIKTLQGRAQIRRTMWSRRAQEYETKINSGDPVSIAEVLRDLKRSNDDTEQSYSERQIYQSALERLAREVAALERITEIEAAARIENMIKGRRSRAAAQTSTAASEAVEAVA
ncbi:MAG: CarD family transcriptional regulator [Pseudobdellovibrionaceae bacterium]